MHRFTLRLAIAAATFIISVALVWLFISRHPRQLVKIANWQRLGFTANLKAQPAPAQSNDTLKLKNLCISGDSLNYMGVEVAKSYAAETNISTVTIRKGKKIFARDSKADGSDDAALPCLALAPLLGGEAKQLVVARYSGGAHCCWSYRIYELYPRVKLIFDGDQWDIGDGFDELEFSNLDGDAELEFVQKIMTFDYFDEMAYAESPDPTIIFKYDRKEKKYLPANHTSPAVALDGIEDEIEEVRRNNAQAKQHPMVLGLTDWMMYRWQVYDILLSYIYARREREAWKFYHSIPPYQLNEKFAADVLDEAKVKRQLKNDPVYKFVYRR